MMRHGCLFDADGPMRTMSRTVAKGPAASRLSGTPNSPSKNSRSQGKRKSAFAWRRMNDSSGRRLAAQ